MIRSRRMISVLTLATAAALAVPSCVVTARGRITAGSSVAYREPPPPQAEPEAGTQRAGYIFVRGRWVWNNNQWTWSAGRWERTRANYTWSDGRWEQRGSQWHWIDGQWVAVGGGGGNVVVDHRGGGGGGTAPVDVEDQRTPQPPAPSMYPTQPPPALQNENAGTKTGHVWIRGRWDWQAGNWTWVPGHWERVKANKRWTDGRWELQGTYYVWIDGGWN